MLVHSAEPYNAAPPLELLRASPITPIPLFFVRNHGTVPVVDPAPYRLAVTGLVDRELRLSLESLRRGVVPSAVAAPPPGAGDRRRGLAARRPLQGGNPRGGRPGGGAGRTGGGPAGGV